MFMVEIFMCEKNDLTEVRYPAATVLLDLTANEECIEQVGHIMRKTSLFAMVIKELEIALTLNTRKPQFSRYRDLLFGIILNLTCNLENE